LRLLYPDMLSRDPALRIQSGIGGVIFLSVPSTHSISSSSRSSGAALVVGRLWNESKEPCRLRGLGTAGRLPLRMRVRVRMLALSEMSCPPFGAAVTMVPGVAKGGGVGESVRKRGWM
jgi:hypothetical protein